jgi:hypothetical protein
VPGAILAEAPAVVAEPALGALAAAR